MTMVLEDGSKIFLNDVFSVVLNITYKASIQLQNKKNESVTTVSERLIKY